MKRKGKGERDRQREDRKREGGVKVKEGGDRNIPFKRLVCRTVYMSMLTELEHNIF